MEVRRESNDELDGNDEIFHEEVNEGDPSLVFVVDDRGGRVVIAGVCFMRYFILRTKKKKGS